MFYKLIFVTRKRSSIERVIHDVWMYDSHYVQVHGLSFRFVFVNALLKFKRVGPLMSRDYNERHGI